MATLEETLYFPPLHNYITILLDPILEYPLEQLLAWHSMWLCIILRWALVHHNRSLDEEGVLEKNVLDAEY